MIRSFIAVESNEEVRKSLSKVQDDLESTGADLKIVKPENIHLTLRFLGNISESRIDLIKQAILDVSGINPFQIRVEGLGVFPRPSFIRVVWAGVTKGSDRIKSLREDLDKKLSEIDHPPDDKEFTPHYTIARVRSGKAKDELNSIVRSKSDKRWGSIEVEEIKLKKSELTPEGPIYTTLKTIEFG